MRTKRSGSHRSYHCLACGKRFYRMSDQARGNVDCPMCGGAGEETDVSLMRRQSHGGRRSPMEVKPYCCEGCGERFRSPAGLALHCRDHPDHVSVLTGRVLPSEEIADYSHNSEIELDGTGC